MNTLSKCRSGCTTQDHESWGDCLRAANLSIKELNELIYSLGITASKGIMCDKELNVSLLNKLYDELTNRIAEEAIDEEVESDTYYVSNEEADEDYRISMMRKKIEFVGCIMIRLHILQQTILIDTLKNLYLI